MIELVLAAAAIAGAPPVAGAAPPSPDPAAVVAATIALVEKNYVVAAKRPAIVAALRKGLASGAYARLEPAELAKRISGDMDAVAHDKHLGLTYQPDMAARMSAAGLAMPDMHVVVTPRSPVACAGPAIAARLAGESTEASVTLPWRRVAELPWI